MYKLRSLGAHKLDGEVDECRDEGDDDDLCHWPLEILPILSPFSNAHVEFDEEASKQSTQDSKEHKGHKLEVMPATVICDLVQDEFAGAEWVARLQSNGCYHGAYKTTPHGLVWKIVGQLLETEEYTPDGCTKSNRDTGCSGCREYFSLSCYKQVS